ncbi:hypothetical protein, partial [Sporisorium scitamineum]
MVRMANRIDTTPASGAVTPLLSAAVAREGASSPYSANSSSDEGNDGVEDRALQPREKKSRKRRTHDSTRESSPAVSPMHRSLDALATTSNAIKDGSRKRTMTRSLSTRSHSKRMATNTLMGMTSSTSSTHGSGSAKKRSGTKSPASMRRSIGM